MCEDQYLKTLDKGDYRVKVNGVPDQSTWTCTRCITAGQSSLITGLPGLPKTIVKQCYCKDNFDGYMYYPVPEFSAGWCQAKRRNRQSLKNIYLSPLGYELNSKEEALIQLEFEKTVHDNLLLSREAEYKEYREQVAAERKPKGRDRKGAGARVKRTALTPEKRTSGRNTTSTALMSLSLPNDHLPGTSTTATTATTTPSAAVAPAAPVLPAPDEDGVLSTGKLCDFRTPPGCRLVWHTVLTPGEKVQPLVQDSTTHSAHSTAVIVPVTVAAGGGDANGCNGDVSTTGSGVDMLTSDGHNAPLVCNADTTATTATAAVEVSSAPVAVSSALPSEPALPSKVSGKGTVPITAVNLPQGGFFGLDEYDIRAHLEALPGSELCVGYRYSSAAEIRESLISECRTDVYRILEKKSIDQRLVTLLLQERSHWSRQKSEMYATMRQQATPVPAPVLALEDSTQTAQPATATATSTAMVSCSPIKIRYDMLCYFMFCHIIFCYVMLCDY
jgi:hypothetical protein